MVTRRKSEGRRLESRRQEGTHQQRVDGVDEDLAVVALLVGPDDQVWVRLGDDELRLAADQAVGDAAVHDAVLGPHL